LLLLALFCLAVFAGAETADVAFYPETPNITTFTSGFQKMLILGPEEVSYTSVTLQSSDFTAADGILTIPLVNNTAKFEIIGQTAGTKYYTLTFKNNANTNSYVANLSFSVSPTPMIVDGPYILNDFNFDKIYSTDQNISFGCWGALDFAVSCEPTGQYRVDGGAWHEFVFDTKILFSFDGNKRIDINAANKLNFSKMESFYLDINHAYVPPQSAQPIIQPAAGTSGGAEQPGTGVSPQSSGTYSPNANSGYSVTYFPNTPRGEVPGGEANPNAALAPVELTEGINNLAANVAETTQENVEGFSKSVQSHAFALKSPILILAIAIVVLLVFLAKAPKPGTKYKQKKKKEAWTEYNEEEWLK